MQLVAGLCTFLAALGLSLVTAFPASAQPTTYYVAANGTNVGNDCTSAANPCATISYALTYATTYGDTVQVSGTINDNPTVPYGVTITGTGAPATSPAVISGVIALEGATLTDVTADGSLRAFGLGNTVSGSSIRGNGIFALQAGLTVTASTISGTVTGIDVERSDVVVSNSTISGNTGDGIGVGSGTVTVSDSTISGNEGDGIGGRPEPPWSFSSATVTGSTIADNGGVGIQVSSESSISDSSISGNGGGGIAGVYGLLTLTNSTVSDNDGAGITWGDCYNVYLGASPMPFLSCPVTVTGSRITGNKGDGIDVKTGDLSSGATVSASTISANAGTGVKAAQGAMVSASTIEDNQEGGLYVNAGGAGFLEGGDINISGNTISGNMAPAGGGMYICECDGLPSNIVISGNTITGNKATQGGGIYMATPLVLDFPAQPGFWPDQRYVPTISDNTVTANTASEGGGIYNVGDVTLSLSTFSGNVAPRGDVVDNAAAPVATPPSTIWAAADIFDGSCQNLATWHDGGYNVGSDSTCLNGGTGDVNSGSGLSGAGLLGPLAENGGPTATMLPLTGNPAIEVAPSGTSVVLDGIGVTLCPVTDQRGVASMPGLACNAGSVQVAPTTLQLHISAPYQDNEVTVVSVWWAAPPGASRFSLTTNERTTIGPYSYTATGLPRSGTSTPVIVQVEGATPLFGATFQVADSRGDVSNTVSYP